MRAVVRVVKFLLWHTGLMAQVEPPCHLCHMYIPLYNELLRPYLQQETLGEWYLETELAESSN